jgi:hypothetical protein
MRKAKRKIKKPIYIPAERVIIESEKQNAKVEYK